jgi:hypothetical protein
MCFGELNIPCNKDCLGLFFCTLLAVKTGRRGKRLFPSQRASRHDQIFLSVIPPRQRVIEVAHIKPSPL